MWSWRVLFVPLISLLGSYFVDTNGANILALMGMASPSHHIWNSVLLHALADRGHNLTILSVDLPRPHEHVPPNAHYIHLEKAYDIYKRNEAANTDAQLDITQYIGLGPFESIPKFYEFGTKTVSLIAESAGMRQLLAYPDDFRFDLVINDFTMGPYLLGFAYKFNYPPIMGVSAFHNPPITIDFMSNHYFPAYTPFHSTSYGPRMNFIERFHNTLIFAADTIYRRWFYYTRIDEIMRPLFGAEMPSMADLAKRTELSLVNSHPAIDYVEALPPNVIEIGGMQIKDVQPLPNDMDEHMHGGKRGAILFSMGTNMKSSDMSLDKIQVILQAFGNLTEYNILWKFDREYLLHEQIPKNVLIKSFLPQRDILGHPKIKAFVTHCGGLSSQEATWRGVPMVGIPLFLDQHRNLLQSVNAGSALKVDYVTMTAASLANTIRHVAEDPQIANNVRARSRHFQDNPMKPLDTAIWWVEYLLREPHPTHLRSPAADLNFVQTFSLDVLLVLVLVLMLLLRVIQDSCCAVSRRGRNRRHKKND